MTIRLRRLREIAVFAVVTAFVGGVVVAAVQADVRSTVRTETNDGGAWLVKQDAGVVGQVDRAAMEVSGFVGGRRPGSDFDIEQAGSVVVVNDRGAAEVSLIDPRIYQVINNVTVPNGVQMAVVENGAVLWTESPLRVWRVSRDELASVKELAVEVEPVVFGDGSGVVTVTRAGTAIVVDRDGDRLVRFAASPTSPDEHDSVAAPLGGRGEGVTAVSAIGEDAVLMDDRSIAIIPASAADENAVQAATAQVVEFDTGTEGHVLAQPSEAGSALVVIDPNGRVLSASTTPPQPSEDGREVTWTMGELTETGASHPLPPIVYAGCVFSLSANPVKIVRWCDGEVTEDELVGVDREASSLRLRLVNGWVWVNDLSTGVSAVVGPEGDIERLDDWGAALGREEDPNDPPDESENQPDSVDDGEALVVDEELPELDEDDENEPPVARDDEVRTRVDQPVVVQALDNDTDPDGDVILVTELGDVPAEAQVGVNADRTAIQVSPLAGYTGTVQFEYTISDGREAADGSAATDTATVTVEVTGDDAANEAPVAEDDRVEVAAGSSVTLNVLDNDTDPDGDALLLDDINAEVGTLTSDPSGRVTFTAPNDTVVSELDLAYTVRDSFGATGEGVVTVSVRLKGSNNEPLAENDSRVTVVGRPITFNVLTNDSDPDNDPLSIAGLLETRNDTEFALAETSLSPDGEFFFTPSKPGVYVFVYTATDGSEEDRAIIRVDVSGEQENRPPTAIRDDVTIARGGTKTVYVLTNDTDPDGDVVAIESWTGAEGLEIEEARGLGFKITVEPGAPADVSFRYSISDGVADPVAGVVVVAVTDAEVIDQAPVARPDTIDLRPGQTGAVRVLLNDYDPEGGALTVVKANSASNAEVRIGPGGQDVFVTPGEGTISSFTFGYDVVDEAGNRSSSFVVVRPVPDGQANRPPIARPDTARTRAGTEVRIPVTVNDSDPDGDAVRVESIAAQPAFGQATLNDDGTVTYRAAPDAVGSDLFRYVLVDAKGAQSIGTVLVGVLPADGQNRPPTATDDSFSMLAGSDPLRLDLLRNDYDPNGDVLAITEVRGGASHAVLDPETGAVTFTPPDSVPERSRRFSFTYTLSDGRGGSDRATVSVEVANASEPVAPIAVADLVGPVTAGRPVEVDVLANDFDPDGSRADLVVSVDDPAVTVGDDGVLTIEVGRDSAEYRYTITDPDGLSSTAVVAVLAVPNRAPQPEAFTVDTEFGEPVTIAVDEHVTDPDDDVMLYACCQSVRHGRASIAGAGEDRLDVRFVPNDGFAGEASFAYQVDDQNGHTVSGAIVVRVKPPANRPPIAENGRAEIEAGTNGLVSFEPFANDPDLATGDRLTFEMLDAGGAPARANGSSVRINAPLDAAGDEYTLRFRVTDSYGAHADGRLVVSVTESRVPPPVANPDVAETNQEQAVTVDVVANDTNSLGEGRLRVVGAQLASGSGLAEVTGDSTAVAFTPGAGFFGQASIEYTIQDARGTVAGRASGLLAVNVLGRPSPPVVTSVSADNATATLTWSSPDSNGAAITGYVVESDQGQSRDVGLTNSQTFDGLANGVAHRFRVLARNAAGDSEWGPWSDPVTPDTEPGTPAAPTVQFADGALIVTWQPPANEGSAITGYELEMGGAGSGKISVGSTSYTWPGLANGANYQFRLVAVNAAGPSATSAWSAAEHPLREPGAPAQPQPTQGDTQIALSWAAGDTNGDPITRYEVRREGSDEIRSTTGTSFTWGNLPNGVTQQFRVRAFNRDPDPGAWSAASVPLKPCGVPDTIQDVSAFRGDGQARVTWPEPDEQGCAISDYTVIASNGMRQSTQSTSYLFGPLTNGTPVTFQVYATNSVGDSRTSTPSNQVTPAGPPIGPGAAGAWTTGVGEITVSWNPANDNGAPLTDYQVIINDGPPQSAGAGDTTFVHAGLAPGRTYTYKVIACNDVGCGTQSSPATATTWSPPAAPAAPALTANDRALAANWTAPANGGTAITGYNVRISPGGTSSTTATSYSWSNLTYGQTYTVDVQACNAVGCGGWSPASSATIAGPPGQVAQPAVTANGNTIDASWNQPNMNGSTLSYYDVDIEPGGATTVTGQSTSFTGLSYDTTYSVRVSACNTSGQCGPYSAWGSATTEPNPAQISIRRGTECGPTSPNGPCLSNGCQTVCTYVHMTATGFAANTEYAYQCYYNGQPFQGGNRRTTDSSGSYVGDLGCYLSRDPATVYVVYGGVRSPDTAF